MSGLSEGAREVLENGRLCYLSATTTNGLHLTPVVFVVSGETMWATTARRTVKARAWKSDPNAAGLIQHGDHAVAFGGKVTLYDVLDPGTWRSAIGRAPDLMGAAARFTLKNARYFAGYARDVRRLPLSWSPPARMMVAVDIEAGVLLDVDAGTVEERWGRWGIRATGRPTFRQSRGSDLSGRGSVRDVRRTLGSSGQGALSLLGSIGPVVLPVAWARAASEGVYYAVLPRPFLAVAGAGSSPAAALVLDRTSTWRAARMRGVLLQGTADVFIPRTVRSGHAALLKAAARTGALPSDPAVVRLRPQRAVWWQGWASGTVRRR